MADTLPNAVSENFLNRSLRMTAALLLLVLLFGWLYFGVWESLSIFSGGVWGVVNILFLRMAVLALLRSGGPDKLTVAGIALIKFPLLYYAGYCLLTFEKFTPGYIVAGFSIFFAVIVLKVIARAILKMDESPSPSANVRRQSVLQ